MRGQKCWAQLPLAKNAKIGSNAVVVKDVPENATAVGIPARILEEEKANKEAKEAAVKNSFTAYAVGGDENDALNPEALVKAIQSLLENANKQEKELNTLKAKIAQLSDEKASADLAQAFANQKPKH